MSACPSFHRRVRRPEAVGVEVVAAVAAVEEAAVEEAADPAVAQAGAERLAAAC